MKDTCKQAIFRKDIKRAKRVIDLWRVEIKIEENWSFLTRTTSDRTKHIDIRTSSVKDYQEDGKIVIKFVKSEDNEADIYTKNATNIIFQTRKEISLRQ